MGTRGRWTDLPCESYTESAGGPRPTMWEASPLTPKKIQEDVAMSLSSDAQREPPNTYFVQDRRGEIELHRLQLQDQLLTTGMGGVLPEQPDPTMFQRVLDVGCGTGGWLLETARTSPALSLLVGIDISPLMISFAREEAQAQGVSDRVQFRTMDALGRLNFPDHSFDLVNQRFGASFLRRWEWPRLLQEYRRVCKPGGVIRVTEFDVGETSSSPAVEALSALFVQALFQAGRFFTEDKRGVTSQLVHLFQQAELQNVQTHASLMKHHAGTSQGQLFIEDLSLLYRTLLPFLRKWTRVPDDYEAIYQQALTEMQHPDFVATMSLLTAWGTTRPF